jgi:hypothetical protein
MVNQTLLKSGIPEFSMSALSSIKPFSYPTSRATIDVSRFQLDADNARQVALGEKSDRQARVDSETLRISRDPTLDRFQRVDRMIAVAGSNGDGTSGVPFKSAAEAAEFAQVAYASLKSGVETLASLDIQLNDKPHQDKMREKYGDEATNKYIASIVDGIEKMRSDVSVSVASFVDNFDVSGPIVTEKENGGFTLNDFSINFRGKGFAAFLTTNRQAPPASLDPASTLLETLDGHVRNWTGRMNPGSKIDRRA